MKTAIILATLLIWNNNAWAKACRILATPQVTIEAVRSQDVNSNCTDYILVQDNDSLLEFIRRTQRAQTNSHTNLELELPQGILQLPWMDLYLSEGIRNKNKAYLTQFVALLGDGSVLPHWKDKISEKTATDLGKIRKSLRLKPPPAARWQSEKIGCLTEIDGQERDSIPFIRGNIIHVIETCLGSYRYAQPKLSSQTIATNNNWFNWTTSKEFLVENLNTMKLDAVLLENIDKSNLILADEPKIEPVISAPLEQKKPLKAFVWSTSFAMHAITDPARFSISTDNAPALTLQFEGKRDKNGLMLDFGIFDFHAKSNLIWRNGKTHLQTTWVSLFYSRQLWQPTPTSELLADLGATAGGTSMFFALGGLRLTNAPIEFAPGQRLKLSVSAQILADAGLAPLFSLGAGIEVGG